MANSKDFYLLPTTRAQVREKERLLNDVFIAKPTVRPEPTVTNYTTTDISREDRDRLDGLAPWEVRQIVRDINAEVDRRIRRAMGDFGDGPTIDATAEPVPDEAARLAGPKK